MNWENLKTNKCPHCSEALIRRSGDEVACTRCFFLIDRNRFLQIKEHRAHPEREKRKMRWQNLHEGNCPACSDYLATDQEKASAVYECQSDRCNFKISLTSVRAILADDTHPANIFRGR